jgi:hypothetical protein
MQQCRGLALAAGARGFRDAAAAAAACVRCLGPALAVMRAHGARGDAAVAVLKFLRDCALTLTLRLPPAAATRLCLALSEASQLLAQRRGALVQQARAGRMDEDDCAALEALAAAVRALAEEAPEDGEAGDASLQASFRALDVLLPLAASNPERGNLGTCDATPELLRDLYELLRLLAERRAEAMETLPAASAAAVSETLRRGIDDVGDYTGAVGRSALLAVKALAAQRAAARARRGAPGGGGNAGSGGDGLFAGLLRCLLGRVMRGAGGAGLRRELVEPAAGALLALVVLDRDAYRVAVEAILSEQTRVRGAETAQRLAAAFTALSSGVEFVPSVLRGARGRAGRVQFRKNLEAFLFGVRGFLTLQ